MTENADPATEPTPTPERRSWWAGLNRTNRIAATVLGGVATVFVAGLIFGAGVLVGSERGDSEREHHHGSESSQHESDDRDQSDEGDRGSEGRDARDDGDGHDGGGPGDSDQRESDQQRRSEAPPSPTPAPPHP